jgi:hypothetical protein
MRRRADTSGSESLDLLLDTLCNTFGGVLFIGLLVVLMLQTSDSSPYQADNDNQQTTADDLQTLRKELEIVREERENLRSAVEAQRRIASTNAPDDIKPLLDQLEDLQAEVQCLIDEAEQLADETAETLVQTDELEQSLENIKEEIDEVREAIELAKAEIRPTRGNRPEGGGEVQTSNKINVIVIVKYKRLFVWHRYDRAGNRLGLNTDEFLVEERTDEGAITEPKRFAGIEIDSSEIFDRRLRERLQQFSPNRFYLAVVVHPDSFEVFQDLKASLIDANYEYQLVFNSDHGGIMDRGGSDSRVQ